MEKEIHEKLKLVTYWLTREDSTNEALQMQIKAESQQYKEQKFKVAVFHSGVQPLYENTLALLKHNLHNNKSPQSLPSSL